MARLEITGKKFRTSDSHPDTPGIGHNKGPPLPPELLEERVVSIAIAAQVADLSDWTLYDLIKRGKGPATVRLCGRKIGIRIKDLKAWIESRITPADAASIDGYITRQRQQAIHPEI